MSKSTPQSASRQDGVAANPDTIVIGDIDLRSSVYNALLSILSLSPPHSDSLIKRGMTTSSIAENRYRTRPRGYLDAECASLAASQFGRDELLSVPGFYPSEDGSLRFGEASGLLIPHRDPTGSIFALGIRPDIQGGSKYRVLTSARGDKTPPWYGPGAEMLPHIPYGVPLAIHSRGVERCVRVTEGQLKADVCFRLDGFPTVGIPGVANQRGIVETLKALGIIRVRLAFDSDRRKKIAVADSLQRLATTLQSDGFTVELEDWNPDDAKGVDDALESEVPIRIIESSEAIREINRVALKLKPTPTTIGGSKLKPTTTTGESTTTTTTGESISGKPDIEIATDRHVVVEQAIAALGGASSLYRRGRSLVTVVGESADALKLTGRTTMSGVLGSPKIIVLSEPTIGCYLTASARFYQSRTDKNGEPVSVDAHPPDWLIRAVATSPKWPGIRDLRAVTECPYPRPDGTIVETEGYDAVTGVLYAPSIKFARLASAPTQSDAVGAWARLKAYLRYFPLASDDDHAVWLAGLLCVIARPAVDGPVPGIAVIGNRAGCGKGLLIDSMVIPGTGRAAPTSNYPDCKVEAGKVKTSVVMSGKLVVSFDNLDEGSEYGSSAIDSLLTSEYIDDRILGSSQQTGEIPVRIAPFLNGNNITPAKDSWRRWLVINLTTELEHPEARGDIEGAPLRQAMLAHRADIVVDALTIIKAHTLAGRPKGDWAAMGSFEDWDAVIRGAVWYATGLDCLSTQRRAADDAPERLAKIAILEGWMELPGGKYGHGGVTAAEALGMLSAQPNDFLGLRAVLLARGRRGELPDTKALGNLLRAMKDTRWGELRLKDAQALRHGAVCWAVQPIGQT